MAAARGLGVFLPDELQLVRDPLGFALSAGKLRFSRWVAERWKKLWQWLVTSPVNLGSQMYTVRLRFYASC